MEELLYAVESLKNMLIARATGSFPDDTEYRGLRENLIKNICTKDRIPRFVKTCRTLDEFWGHIREKSETYQGRRDYLREQFEELLTDLEEHSSPADEILSLSLSRNIDSAYIHENWQKALERRETDPEGAITIARTLLETVCKHIMDDEGVVFDDKWELPKLYKGVQNILNLAPNSQTEEIFKQILGGCTSVVTGLGAIRNKLSDAHGRSGKTPRPSTRHAQLAVNLSGAMADFLISSYNDKKGKDY